MKDIIEINILYRLVMRASNYHFVFKFDDDYLMMFKFIDIH